jgi:hypothetical protein
LIQTYPNDVPGSQTLGEVRTLLDQIEPGYKIISSRRRDDGQAKYLRRYVLPEGHTNLARMCSAQKSGKSNSTHANRQV